MTYEKPALLILSFACPAIRSGGDADGLSTKGVQHAEQALQADGNSESFPPKDGSTQTSSTSSAYEADE